MENQQPVPKKQKKEFLVITWKELLESLGKEKFLEACLRLRHPYCLGECDSEPLDVEEEEDDLVCERWLKDGNPTETVIPAGSSLDGGKKKKP